MNGLTLKINTAEIESILENVARKVIWEFAEEINKTKEEENRWLTLTEAATYLKISKVTLYNWMRKGLVISHGISRRRFFSLHDLNEAIRKRNSRFYHN